MKTDGLKKLIKEAVREAIQEELKDILLEAVRAPKLPIQETYQMNNLLQPVTVDTTTQVTNSIPQKSSTEKRAMMESIMGDMRRGQSLIVWAISEGREAARQVDIYLMGKSDLATKNEDGDLVGL